MDRNEFNRCRDAIRAANAALNAHLDTVDTMFESGTGRSTQLTPPGSAGVGSARWLTEYDRLIRLRDVAEAALAARL